ncbi:hypothetical protein [Micromonospora sp. NPDC023633]
MAQVDYRRYAVVVHRVQVDVLWYGGDSGCEVEPPATALIVDGL